MRIFSSHELDELSSLLGKGHVVALPTDTVYGLAARPDKDNAIEMVYSLKGRPASMVLPLLAADLDDVLSLLGELPPRAVALAKAFWPGALTMVVPAPRDLAASVGGHDGTVGIRVPALGVVRRLLARSGPLAVTSANRHGEAPCMTAREVLDVFGTSFEPVGVLEGPSGSGISSTVVRIDDAGISLLREGSLSEVALHDVLTEAGF